MNKFERFSIGHHLSMYPDEWNYKQIMDELKNGNKDENITFWCMYEYLEPEDLAELIQNMTNDLQEIFN